MQLENKVGIVIVTYNLDARIFLLQIEGIKKFCKDDFEIRVIDNSSNPEMSRAIKYHAENLSLSYIRTSASSINGTDSHAFSANVSYSFVRNTYDYLFYLDHDCIPVKPFSIVEILKDKIMAGLGQGKEIPYFWAGCVMWNNKDIDRDLINFSPNHQFKIDTGGELWKVIDIYGKDKCTFFDEIPTQNPDFTEGFYNFYAMIHDGTFMHFINSSGWNPSEKQTERLNSLLNIAKQKIDGISNEGTA